MDKENHHGHYDYFLSDKAIAYRKKIKMNKTTKKEDIDKFLLIELNDEIMDYINEFYLNAIAKATYNTRS